MKNIWDCIAIEDIKKGQIARFDLNNGTISLANVGGKEDGQGNKKST